MSPRQGEIWWAEAEGKRRPVLIVTRADVIPVLNRVMVAPITRTVREIPTEIVLDVEEGMPVRCAANFDNLQPLSLAFLTTRVGALATPRFRICQALSALADC